MQFYKIINQDTWPRRQHCAVFRDYLEPCYCVSLELDITQFLHQIRSKALSFSYAFMYAVASCANEIEEFRYRFLDGEVVLYDRIDTAFTYLDDQSELFKVVRVPMVDSLTEYVKVAQETAVAQEAYFTGPLGNDVFQFSALPWVHFTHVSHTISGKKDQATPLFDWGKYMEKDGKVLLPFSVQVHHSFVDGIHIGKFVERLETYLDGKLV